MTFTTPKQTTSAKQQENDELLKTAHTRVDEMEFNDAEHDFIWSDWDNMDDHIDWLITATRKEIKSWIDANY